MKQEEIQVGNKLYVEKLAVKSSLISPWADISLIDTRRAGELIKVKMIHDYMPDFIVCEHIDESIGIYHYTELCWKL